jgi:hypothetical protein
MTTVLHPPQLGPAAPPFPPPPPVACSPSRATIGAAVASLVASIGALTVAGIGWATAHSGSAQSQTTLATIAPDAGQIAAARTKACQMWRTSANLMDDATNVVAQAPKNWSAPETQEALAAEARVVMVESAYLRHNLPAETPSDVRAAIDEYLVASVDMENATARRKGSARDIAINQANQAESKITTACR